MIATFIQLSSFLLGSKTGRVFLSVGFVAVLVLIVLWRVYVMGRNAEKRGQLEKQLEDLKAKIEVDDELRQMSPDERRDALREWVRNG